MNTHKNARMTGPWSSPSGEAHLGGGLHGRSVLGGRRKRGRGRSPTALARGIVTEALIALERWLRALAMRRLAGAHPRRSC